MQSDEQLMLDFQLGSREAFEELFDRYREPLYGFFRRRIADRQRAEDLTQETFLAVVQARARYEPRARVRTYLYGIALHLVSTERRKNAKRDSSLDLTHDPATTASPEATIWVTDALNKLTAAEREILMLREYEQLSYTDIADLLRLPVNTVRSRLFRARMWLREYLKPGAAGAGREMTTERGSA